MHCYEKESLQALYDEVIQQDLSLKNIVKEYGYPPVWIRPNNFETLVLTILEQQVSLASAYAAYKKLKQRTRITPARLLELTDEELRASYLSRQKIIYVRELARAILEKRIDLKRFETMEDKEVRESLKQLKGIGDWTVDIYLIHALKRADVFPIGDLALLNAIKMLKGPLTKEEIQQKAQNWKPYRSIATMLFWHYYIRKRNIILLH